VSLPARYFADMYAAGPDPWGFRDRWYEQRKRALTLACLPRRHFRRGVEGGCSNGELTAGLAERCGEVIGIEVDPAALAAATERLAGLPVTLRQGSLPGDWPAGPYDLAVLSEVLYYLDEPAVAALGAQVLDGLAPDGVVLACHWRHPVADYPQTGDAVHPQLAAALRLPRLVHHAEADLVLEVWGRDGRSVADVEGLLG